MLWVRSILNAALLIVTGERNSMEEGEGKKK